LNKVLIIGLAALMVMALVGCAAGPNDQAGTEDEDGKVAGFWLGLWHGVIAPITLIISWFSDTVSMYEVHNNGGWYDFGFMFGLAAFWGGSGGAAGSRRK
jgi:hypothetical protein